MLHNILEYIIERQKTRSQIRVACRYSDEFTSSQVSPNTLLSVQFTWKRRKQKSSESADVDLGIRLEEIIQGKNELVLEKKMCE